MVRSDLTIPQQTVQACHAAIKAARDFPLSVDHPHPNLVVCSVPDEASLLQFCAEVRAAGVRCADFQEEDLDNETTAFATETVSGAQRRIFRKCRLLSTPVACAA